MHLTKCENPNCTKTVYQDGLCYLCRHKDQKKRIHKFTPIPRNNGIHYGGNYKDILENSKKFWGDTYTKLGKSY